MANGAPAESYRDDGNRWLFHNHNTGWHNTGWHNTGWHNMGWHNMGWDLPPKPVCAPVLTGGPVVDATWRRLLDRAGPRPSLPLTQDPGLHLSAGGTRHDATRPRDDVYVFSLPDIGTTRLLSRASAPQELGTARDPRCLGIAVRRLVIRQANRFRIIDAADPRLADGFHGFEADAGVCWTNGDAILPATLFEGFAGAVELLVYLGGSACYIDDDPGAEDVMRAA